MDAIQAVKEQCEATGGKIKAAYIPTICGYILVSADHPLRPSMQIKEQLRRRGYSIDQRITEAGRWF